MTKIIKSLWTGIAEAADLWGAFDDDRYFILELEPRDARASLASDWERIGNDFRHAIAKFGAEHSLLNAPGETSSHG